MKRHTLNRICSHNNHCLLFVFLCSFYALFPYSVFGKSARSITNRKSLSEIVLSYFVIDAGIGYSTLIENAQNWNINGNIGAQLGIGYEMRIHGFWLSTGLDFQYHSYNSKYTFNMPVDAYDALDTQGKSFHMKLYFDKLKGEERFIFANIPLMFGFYHRSDFYVGVGARIGHTLYSHAKTTLNYHSEGEYRMYAENFKNMQPYGYGEYEFVDKNNLGYKFRCTLVGEIGYDILSIARQASKADRNGLKIGAFVEYGITNMWVESKNDIYYFDRIPGGMPNEYNGASAHSIPFLVSQKAEKAKVLPLYFGVKFSWMFEMNTKRCRTCW